MPDPSQVPVPSQVDVAIIGAGSAGMAAYRQVAAKTDRVLLIEGETLGTTCARVGCMPSKLLIAAAEAADHGRHTGVFGVRYAPPAIDGRAVMDRVRQERDRFVGFVVETVEEWPEPHRVMAHAQFVDDTTLSLSTGETVRADRIIIATGSRPNVPPPFKAFGDRLIVNDDVFSWQELPESCVVFGAGVIGLELGQALHKLGVRTTLFGRDHLVGPLTDPAVLEAARSILCQSMPFHPHGEVTQMRQGGDGVEIVHIVDGQEVTETYQYALVATGRRPNTDTLNLAATSLELDARGVPLFDPFTRQCGNTGIFIAGDAANEIPLLHEAADDGRVSGANAANWPDVRAYRRSAAIGVVFSDPQIMMVGQSHRQLTQAGIPFETGAIDYGDQGRARVMGVNRGLLHVYGQRGTGRFLGAEMIGPAAEHLAHLLAWSVQSGLTVSEMLERPFYHPVIEEGVRSALRSLNAALKMGAKGPPRCIDCGPGA